MLCDFPQIHGGPQISYFINILKASLSLVPETGKANLLKKPKFMEGDDVQ